MVLEFLTELFHGGHIRKKDRLHNSLFDQPDFGPGKLAAKEVVIRYVQELDSLCGMEILLDVVFTIHLTNGRLRYDMVPIIETIVLNIMTKSGHN